MHFPASLDQIKPARQSHFGTHIAKQGPGFGFGLGFSHVGRGVHGLVQVLNTSFSPHFAKKLVNSVDTGKKHFLKG